VILDDYQGVATSYADWPALPDVTVEALRDHLGPDSLVDALAGAAIVVAMRERTPITAELLERLPDLRLLVTTGMRNASIDLEACRERGITVCGTSALATPTVELTWALIHALTRHLLPEALALRDGRWQTTIGTDLAGSTLGLLGLGRIGSRVAAVARAFEMDVAAWSPHLTEERAAEAGARPVTKRELFAGSDVVSVHLVLSDTTRGIVGADELGAMRPSAYFVNTSRAGLVETEALLEALDQRQLAGAALDVFDEEPLPVGHRLRSHPRVLATPHLGYVSEGNYRTYFTEAVEDIAAWLAGEPVRILV
jgi:phosphoglycerate dehydrogenase-like enzyme